MERKIEKKQRRFQIEKLEERIAPAHLTVELPAEAANGADGIETYNNGPGIEHSHKSLRPIIAD